MSWLFSQALVEEYSADTCSDGEPSALSSGSHIQQAYLLPDKMTAFSRLSRFGMTFKPLTENRGAELLTLYLEAFPVRTFQQPGEALASKEHDRECGEKWRGWLAKFDPGSCLWKTAQCSLLEEEPESLQTLPRSGMTRSGMLWERQTLVPRISETESGSWHTPTVCGNYNRKGLSKTSGDGLATAVTKWPTPQASDNRDRGNLSSGAVQRRMEKGKQISLSQSVSESSGALNPTWVEWLMGWPLGWTDLKPLGTDKFQQWQQQHLRC